MTGASCLVDRCSNDAKDPSTWIYNVCMKLKSETGIQLEISQRPDELIKEFNQVATILIE